MSDRELLELANAPHGVMAPQAQSRLLELVNKLDGYLNSPEQIALRDELLAELRADGVEGKTK